MRNLWRIALTVALLTSLLHAQQGTSTMNALLFNRELAEQGITPPKLLSSVDLDYPDDARIKRFDGMCTVLVVIDTEGNPQNPRLIHCTDPSFEESSLNAVKQLRFQPATMQDGKPVPVTIQAGFQYHLVKHFLRLRVALVLPLIPVGRIHPYIVIPLRGIPEKRLNIDRHMSRAGRQREVSKPIRYGFIPQRGGASEPGPDGVYPLTRSVTAPRVIKFSDEGYGREAFVHEGNGSCDVLLTINMKGKATDPQVTHCERPELEKPAVESLLKSQYEPGIVNGIEVPMRASIHLDYGDSPSKPE